MLRVDVHGEGDNVVVLHGLPVPAESVDVLVERLAESYRVVVPHMEGIGVDVVDALDLLKEALLAHEVRRTAIVGHSFGAYRAFQLASSEALRVTRIAAIGPIANVPAARRAEYDGLADALEAGQLSIGELAHALSEQWYGADFRAQRSDIARNLERWFSDIGLDGLITAARVETAGPDLRPALSDLSIPVYLRVGAEDGATPPEWGEEIHELLPNARLDIVDGVGHFAHVEDSEATFAAVALFLAAG